MADAGPTPPPSAAARPAPPPRQAAVAAVTAGILLTRLVGLARERTLAYFLGNSDAAGAFRAALRIPNLLQNLFGEGALSASFIPVYAKLKAEGQEALARQVAGTVLAMLTAVVALLVGVGMLFTQSLTELVAPGYTGEARLLTSDMVRIMFPGVGLLVLSAWALGVLNSHRRFFLPYVAPVFWNIAIITALAVAGAAAAGGRAPNDLALAAAWGTAIGAALQLAVQLPAALRLNGGLGLALPWRSGPVRVVLRNFAPALLSRGVVQLSGYIDQVLASYLGPVAVAAMANAQTLYTLPVALFGTAVAAAELPEMSVATGTAVEIAAALKARLTAGLTRIAFFIVPSAIAFVLLGDVIAATLFQTGRFTAADSQSVWILLIGSAVGLVASTQSRLCVSVFWALGDTRSPTRFAVLRVALTAGLGYAAVFPLRAALALAPMVAASLLVATAGVAGWAEFLLIRRALIRRIGVFPLGSRAVMRCWVLAFLAAAGAFGLKTLLPPLSPLLRGVLVLGCYGGIYLGASALAGADEVRGPLARARRLLARRRGSRP